MRVTPSKTARPSPRRRGKTHYTCSEERLPSNSAACGLARGSMSDLVLALTGASGSPYGVRLLEVLLRAGRTVHLTISPAAVEVMERELDRTVNLDAFQPVHLLASVADKLDLSRL